MDTVLIDPGSSGTKVLALANDFLHGRFISSGAVLTQSLSEGEWERRLSSQTVFGAGIVELGEQCWRVGDSPRTCLSSSMKHSSLVAKAIAVLGSLDLTPEIRLVVLLPKDEFISRRVFADSLRAAIDQGAKFNGKPVQCAVKEIRVLVEGEGLIAQAKGAKDAALMCGHSDVSLLRFFNGQVDLTDSKTFAGCGLGLLANKMNLAGPDIDVAKAVISGNFKPFSHLQIPLEHLREESEQVIEDYFSTVINPSLASQDWHGVSGVVLGGGGAKFFKKHLDLPIPIRLWAKPKHLNLFNSGLDSDRFADLYWAAMKYIGDEIESRVVHAVNVEVA